MKMRIIGLCGQQGSGKDTVGALLAEHGGFCVRSFGARLKDVVAAIFGWDRALLEGRTAESRAWRERVDPWWAARMGDDELTPRKVLQGVGTDAMREHFHAEVWIAALEREVRDMGEDACVVITDCRFPNEIDTVKRMGGEIWMVTRGALPAWWARAAAGKEVPGVHASETAWVAPCLSGNDTVHIPNDGTLEDLAAQVANRERGYSALS